MLTVTGLTDGEYLLSSVALGIDEYYAGVGEAPGVWSGGWAAELGVEGLVEPDQLRAVIDGKHPVTGAPLLAGWRERTVKAFDLTFSAPKSVSLLWALGSEPVADVVMAAHRDAVQAALGFLEDHAATARVQIDGIRRHVPTRGWAVAGFVHRTSREGDPQLHSHCLVPNVVQREVDGRCVALAARPLFVWARAAGSVYQAELQRALAVRLGVAWQPDRHNTREMGGFSPAQLRAFSKRAVEIEAELEARGAVYESPVLRMRADDEASLATRPAKDHSVTPTMLVGRWAAEACAVELAVGRALDQRVCSREPTLPALSFQQIARVLIDDDAGLCAHSPRFAEHDVIEHVAGLSAGRLTVEEIQQATARFLDSDLVVRPVPSRSASGWEPVRWSTSAHRALEDDTLDLLDTLTARSGAPIADDTITATVATADRLGADQQRAVGVLCSQGGSVRAVLAPAGHGKTAMIFAAAHAATADGRPVIAVATTAKAVAELSEAGLDASTIARLRIDLLQGPLAAGAVVVLDEISQTSTRDMHTVLGAVAACPGAQLWVLGDPRQAPAVKAGGIATEIDRRITAGTIPAASLTVNRRQLDPIDRHALAILRAGDPVASQQMRSEHGWEHQATTPSQTRDAMADAVATDIVAHGGRVTVALVVSHGQAEDLADRIRRRLTSTGLLAGPTLTGPGWTTDRSYQAGDRILLHTRHSDRHSPLVNGTVATITAIDPHGLHLHPDRGDPVWLPTGFVQGTRADGSPNVSHAWARTVDGAQGGTWDHAHLLGSAALDAYRGYAGQSRSRHPTHTWNTAALDHGDHGGRLADLRSPHQQVAAALARIPDTAMAAPDDPWRTDRRLRAVIDAHHSVLDRQPPDRTRELAAARQALTDARGQLTVAEQEAAATATRLEQLGPLTVLTRSGRADRRQLETDLDTGHAAVVDAAGTVARVEDRVRRVGRDQAAHDQFEVTEGWRRDAITAAVDRLNTHWTAVAVACVDADQPLAYGIGPLRHAHTHLTSQLAAIEAALPADGATERRAARRDVTDAVHHRHDAERQLATAQQHHQQLAEKRWPRRDSHAIGRAADHVDRAHHALDRAGDTETDARRHLAELDSHHKQRRQALERTGPQRRQLTNSIEAVDDALDRTRTARVLALAREPSPEHVEALGPVPIDPAARAVWCHAAHRLEAHLDYKSADEPAVQALYKDLGETPELCTVAEHYLRLRGPAPHPHHWAEVTDRTSQLYNQLTMERSQTVERPHLGRDIGLGLGL